MAPTQTLPAFPLSGGLLRVKTSHLNTVNFTMPAGKYYMSWCLIGAPSANYEYGPFGDVLEICPTGPWNRFVFTGVPIETSGERRALMLSVDRKIWKVALVIASHVDFKPFMEGQTRTLFELENAPGFGYPEIVFATALDKAPIQSCPKEDNSTLIIIIVVAGAAFLIVGGLSAYFLFLRKKPSNVPPARYYDPRYANPPPRRFDNTPIA